MVKDEEETEKDEPSHRATDNSGCPSSIVLTIGISATTTSGSNSNAGRLAGRLALLAEWVSRIEGMRDIKMTGRSDVGTTSRKPIGGTILTLAVWYIDKSVASRHNKSFATDLSLVVTKTVVFGGNRLTQKRESSFAPNVMLMVGAMSIGTKLTV